MGVKIIGLYTPGQHKLDLANIGSLARANGLKLNILCYRTRGRNNDSWHTLRKISLFTSMKCSNPRRCETLELILSLPVSQNHLTGVDDSYLCCIDGHSRDSISHRSFYIGTD